MPIRFGIVGCGTIAPVHAAAIQRTDGAALVAATSQHPEQAQAFAAAHGIDWTPDLPALLRRPDVDVVTICTPSGLHAEMACAAMLAGKHVVVEKPLAISLEQADAMLRTSRETGRALAVISQSRFAPGGQEVHAAVTTGRLGRLLLADLSMKSFRSQAYYVSAGWRGTSALGGGGELVDQGTPGVDLPARVGGAPPGLFTET